MENINNENNTNNSENIENEIINKTWKIIISCSFLDLSFEKFYQNFLLDWVFDESAFLKSLDYVSNMLSWDNYSDRLSNINIHQELILNIFKWNYPSLQSLNESMILDIASIIWKTDDLWMLELNVSDIDFLDDTNWVKTVKDWIKSYILKLKQEIKTELFNSNLWEIQKEILIKIKEVLPN